MKKTRKQTALAKYVLATIMAMGMMGYTTVWADTPTPSPVDKDVSKDAAGQIYDASHNYDKGYFWTDLGHAQVQIGSGEQIELFTPFIYHTNTRVWDPTSNSYNPVHTGDNSEMKCKESMSRITVGEFDRIIKSLYTNDITMAKTIYGEGDQAGLKDKVIKEVTATPGQGATVNTYKLVRENGTDVAVGIVDTDTKVVDNKLTFTDGKLTSKITDNAGGSFESTVEGIASQEWVNNQLNGIGGTDTVTTAESGHAIITVVDANEALPTDNKHHVIGINEDALRGFIQEAAQDTNTTNTSMEGSLDEYGKLTVKVKDSDQHSVQAEVEGIASRSWVTNQLEDIVDTNTITTVEAATNILKITDEGVEGNHAYKIDINGDQLGDFVQQYDTNTITTAQDDGKNYVTVNGGKDDNGNYNYTVGFNEDKLIETIQENDTNTITTAESGHAIITVNDSVGGGDLDDKNYVIGIDEDALKGFIQENTQDTNTITTVAVNTNILTIEDNGEDGNHAYELGINSEQLGDFVKQYDTNTITTAQDDGNGYVNVAEAVDADGNYKYTVGFDEGKLIQTIEDQDRYVNGGSIGEDGSITLNVHNGRDVTLEGQMKDARLTDIERDKEAGTATLVVKDRYNPEEVNRLTIDDIASKTQNDREHAEFREHFNELDYRVDNLGSRVDKVGAGAAALAALHPMDFDPDDKLTFAAGYGNYKGKNAAAVGAFYRPDEKVMLSVGGTFGNGENMVNAGISFSLDRTARVSNSRTAMAKEIVDLRANVANLTALVGQLTAGMGGTIEMDRMKLFPDVPENHWAYEYIGRLAAAGIVEGYPDGMFNGNRMMSRYEFAAMLYRALEKGVKLDHKLVREFEPEMGRIHVARISGADGDRGKIERVRVYGGDNRDHYGSKLK
ncbi:YadA-like family protein [Phascolarctobacterium succinatutens]|uniref:YadA-like family protein n=1 Tax=Phascolarctobacterium succinatutens TaxID=626940 RepID=UPI0026ED2C00|nr:YadA-like family protein [Phascolarctobacterium succinatutens]